MLAVKRLIRVPCSSWVASRAFAMACATTYTHRCHMSALSSVVTMNRWPLSMKSTYAIKHKLAHTVYF